METPSRQRVVSTALPIAQAPAVAMGMTYLAMADSIGLAMQNAVACQQRSQITANTATTVATARILRAASG